MGSPASPGAPARTPEPRLLWVDCMAGALAGVLVLAFSGWLGRLHGLPQGVLILLGTANLVYATYSFSLARSAGRTPFQIAVLVYANAAWAVVCLGLAVRYWERASAFGYVHLVGEAIFVGGLAALQWGQRKRLVSEVRKGA